MLINWIRIQILTTWRWGGAKYPFPEPRLPGTEDDLSPRLLSTDPARSPRLPATDPARCSRLAIEPFLTPISYPRSEPAENKLNGVFANPSPPPLDIEIYPLTSYIWRREKVWRVTQHLYLVKYDAPAIEFSLELFENPLLNPAGSIPCWLPAGECPCIFEEKRFYQNIELILKLLFFNPIILKTWCP